mgnify:CR=1 FL=1
MNVKIAIVTPVFPPYRGGMGRIAQDDARQLLALGLDVTVFAPAAAARRENGYAVRTLRCVKIGNAAFAPFVGGLLRQFDVVILHYPFFGAAEPLALARRLGKGRLIISYHMDPVGRGVMRPVFRAYARFVMPQIMRVADKILVTSLDYARRGVLAPLIDDRYIELPPSVDTIRFSPGPKSSELLARYGLAAADRIIVTVGGLDSAHYFKGVPQLLAAMARPELVAAKAIIVGEGGLRPELEKESSRLGVAGRVIFAGGVSEHELAPHYRLADVFAFPSIDKSEAFGLAALEALSCGVPVVASDLPGVRTIVRDGETGFLVPAGNVPSLATKLAAVLDDDALRTRFSSNARILVETRYTEEARRARWQEIM